jgi:hypothetical protein
LMMGILFHQPTGNVCCPDNSSCIKVLLNDSGRVAVIRLNKTRLVSGRQSYNWNDFKKMLSYFNIEALTVSTRHFVVDGY